VDDVDLEHYYLTDELAVFRAPLVSVASILHTIVSSPVLLTADIATKLLLNVTRDFNSTRHVFNAKLLSGSSGVSNKTIKLKLNQTEYGNTTDADGLAQFVLWLSPQAENNQNSFQHGCELCRLS